VKHKQNKYIKWYQSKAWRTRRAYQLAEHPFCELCLGRGIATLAGVVDHVIPHCGDYVAFRSGEVQSLCADCHDKRKKMIDLRGYLSDVDERGWPTDPRHPSNVREASRDDTEESR
jgi:5-methylcytosine-specific restriction endonuclease McrA